MDYRDELITRSGLGQEAGIILSSPAFQQAVADRIEELKAAVLGLIPADAQRFTAYRGEMCALEDLQRRLESMVSDGEYARRELEEGPKQTLTGRII